MSGPTCSNARRELGLAYPRTCQECGLGPCKGGEHIAPKLPLPAMTLRDYFAAKAMAIVYHGYCEQGTTWPKPHCFSQIAQEAFEMADAMLKAR